MKAHTDNGEANQAVPTPVDARARETYRHLKETGLTDTDIMAFAGELLSLVASDFRSQSAAAE